MKDLIYREDAIKAVTGLETDPTDGELEYALSNVPSADENKWFRASDRLPDVNRLILFVPDKFAQPLLGRMNNYEKFEDFEHFEFNISEIRFWMYYFNLDIPKDV
jgi:hypothetical protein